MRGKLPDGPARWPRLHSGTSVLVIGGISALCWAVLVLVALFVVSVL